MPLFRRTADKPIRLEVQDGAEARPHKESFREPIRCGYGEDCALPMIEGTGPDVIFELSRTPDAVHLSTPLAPEQLQDHVELFVDGEPFRMPAGDLKSGSRLEIVDKHSDRRYSLVIDPISQWFVRRRFLAGAILVLTLVGGGYGSYVYTVLSSARQQLVVTQERLSQTEAGMERATIQLRDALRRIDSAQAQLSGAISELRLVQEASNRDIRMDFDHRLSDISNRARENLARLSEEDTRAREQLERDTRENIATLRQEFSAKMVDTYQSFKGLEGRLFLTLASRIESIELECERFKRILLTARDAVVFIHTRYEVEFIESGETKEYDSFGTGFLISADGLGLTAQHVLFPWRYEREFLLLKELELARIVPDTMRWSMWPTGTPVSDLESAYHSDREDRSLRFLYAPDINVAEELASTPVGMVKVPVPVPDGADIGVFQIMDFDTRFDNLTMKETVSETEPLDDVLVVGYPFSRLREGVAIPQAVRGFVRLVGAEVMELDTALHPGLSGGPVLNREGKVIGMAIAVFQSDVYGIAVRQLGLDEALENTVEAVRQEEQRLAQLNCDPGEVDGRVDRQTQAAYRCEREKAAP